MIGPARVSVVRLHQRRPHVLSRHSQADAGTLAPHLVCGANAEVRNSTVLGCAAAHGTEQRTDEEWIADCRRRLEETIRMRLMSDVPLGMFLSGGVDSSSIAAMMQRMVTGPVKTFSVGYQRDCLQRARVCPRRSPGASTPIITKC